MYIRTSKNSVDNKIEYTFLKNNTIATECLHTGKQDAKAFQGFIEKGLSRSGKSLFYRRGSKGLGCPGSLKELLGVPQPTQEYSGGPGFRSPD